MVQKKHVLPSDPGCDDRKEMGEEVRLYGRFRLLLLVGDNAKGRAGMEGDDHGHSRGIDR